MLATHEQQNKISPPILKPVITPIRIQGRNLAIARDDLLEGGTKQRAAIPYIQDCLTMGRQHFVYASPFSGFAQVALAHACQSLGTTCTLFCERDLSGEAHEFTLMAQSYGARVILAPTLESAHEQSLEFCYNDQRKMLIPLGLNDELFRDHLRSNLTYHWQELIAAHHFPELWLPVGSGTLLSVFRNIVGAQTKIFAVNVNVLPEDDERITRIKRDPKIHYIRHPKAFHSKSGVNTPVASNEYYDSKVFEIFKDEASSGALWWNVAR